MNIFNLEICGDFRKITILGLFKISWHTPNNLKKIAVFGNCATNPIAKMLETSLELKENYEVLILKPCFLCDKQDVPKIYKQVKRCDVLVTQNIIGQHYKKLGLDTATLQSRLKKKAKLIVIPTPYFTGYNPEQVFLSGAGNIGEQADEHAYLPPLYHNKFILYGFINKIKPEKILEILNAEQNLQSIQENITKNIEELQRREANTDFKISEFIENNYKQVRLFWSVNHPTNALLKFMAEEVLKLLNIEEKIQSKNDDLNFIRPPILNSVYQELNLTFEKTNTYTLNDIKLHYKYYEAHKDIVQANASIVDDINITE